MSRLIGDRQIADVAGCNRGLGMGWRAHLKNLARACAATVLATLCFPGWASCIDPTRVSHSQRIVTVGAAVQNEVVALPDTLNLQQRSPATQLRYWIDTSSCADTGAALYVFRVGAPYRAYTHTQTASGISRVYAVPWLPSASWADALIERLPTHVRNGRTPAVYTLPAGTQGFELELTAQPYMVTGLTTVLIGPAQPLATRQARDYDGLSRGSDLVAGISIFIGLIAIFLSWRRPLDQGLRWFAMGCAVWGLRNLLYINATLPGNGHAIELFLSVGVVFCGVSMALSALYATAQARPAPVKRLNRALLVVVVASAFSLFIPALAMPTRLFSFLLTMVAMGGVAWVLFRSPAHALGVSRRVQHVMAWAMLAQVVAGGHDFGIVLGLRPPDSPAVAFWGFTGLVLALAVLSGTRIVAALGRAENTAAELEQRVAEKNAALQQSFAAVREADLITERRYARAQERERLNREMHDGLGAQLITALRGVERGALDKNQVVEALQQGLDELRLLMDASDLGRSLHGALLAWRNRWEDRLQAVGITLEWHLDPALEDVELGGDTTLHIMRVLQEATTNVVKHANASLLQIDASRDGNSLSLTVIDNGTSLPTATQTTDKLADKGRGLRNMHRRAGHIGATLEIKSRERPLRGTQIRLLLAFSSEEQISASPSEYPVERRNLAHNRRAGEASR